MEKVKGTITRVSQKEGKYGIEMGTNNWYNAFGKAPCDKGDEVEITYEVNGVFKNIQQVYVIKKGEGTPQTQPNTEIQQMSKLKNKTNAKICALTCATKLSEKGSQPEVITALADGFFDWIYDTA